MKNLLKTLFFAFCFFGFVGVAQAQTTNNNVAKTDTTKKKETLQEKATRMKKKREKIEADLKKSEDSKNASEVLRGTLNNTPKPTPTDKDKPKKKE